ncbi:MAG: hypothetical protein K6D96_09235 [Acetatifactor sp.]|nr:hypothetical protein [Acetatifactor sp.]
MAISGSITNEGESVSVSYSGGIQSYAIPKSGVYKFDIYGAQGGSKDAYSGGAGGRAIGYKYLKRGTVLYIGIGGQGSQTTGGYNGGGSGSGTGNPDGGTHGVGCGGGGATHIATVSGTLSSIGYTNFVTNQKGLIVAGGGGGMGGSNGWWPPNYNFSLHGYNGGAGGGTSGGNVTDNSTHWANGGTQTGGGAGNTAGTGSFGQGGANGLGQGAGGGGGFFGGGGGYWMAGAGGSGWIGGVPSFAYKGTTYSPSMNTGVNGGNGSATITLIKKGFPTVYLGSVQIDESLLGNIEIDEVYLGNTPLA